MVFVFHRRICAGMPFLLLFCMTILTTPITRAGELPPPSATAGTAALAAPPPYFDLASAVMDERLADLTPPKNGEYDYAQYRILSQLLEAAARMVAERGTEAFTDFQPGGQWFDPAKGRYLSVYDQSGRCLFNADAPYRAGPLFQPLTRQELFTSDEVGKLRWRQQCWRTGRGANLVRQVAAQMAVHGPRGRDYLVCLHAAAPLLPYDRGFAISLADEAAQLVCAQGERSFNRFNQPGTPFTALPGVGVFVSDEKGTLLTSSLEPELMGRNFADLKDETGKSPARQMLTLATRGGGWYSGTIQHPLKGKPVRLMAYARAATSQNQKYLVGVILLPGQLRQEVLNAQLRDLRQPLSPLAAEFIDSYSLARALKNNGAPYQSTLAFPAENAKALASWPAYARLAGARGFDFCYAAVYEQDADATAFAKETDRLWRDELMVHELTQDLSDLSLTRLWTMTRQDPGRLAQELRRLNAEIMEEAFSDLKNTQLALCYQYGKLVEALFIGTQLMASGSPEDALRALAGSRKDLVALHEASIRAAQEQLPLAEEMAFKLKPLRELFSKGTLNPADLTRLRTESARLRVDMLRDAQTH